jgi:hypothetical protein
MQHAGKRPRQKGVEADFGCRCDCAVGEADAEASRAVDQDLRRGALWIFRVSLRRLGCVSLF